ncbi:hypothetical protein SAMN05421636_103331 [Pricia antarctica]|uniref:Uncharacterized protein n=1 Tax=Pricia antarctica TaxID=641691 RepID=A0A1G7AD87_9FLAO|nr:hypothetical protein [Pricia antarctica]SDE12740.1 hypothetical protein SAMN05421636_103331 [Pricia antarctica]
MHGYLAPHPELFYEATGEVVETVGDICLIAHKHNRIYKAVEVNGARIVQCGFHSAFVGKFTIVYEDREIKGYVKRMLGLQVNMRIENPTGHRIQEIYYKGSHLDFGKTYNVGFVTTQGVAAKYGRNRKKT